ncbi:MAG: pyrroline-5-carboxylate reductase [Legionellales bacterium]|nr:pyrroline-5-carboxylate reductase [Legionellales bacterium]|tara:strand:- start:141 stop:956 length:816 start_codon:yes stop_codon:yes gene_type:complete
MSLQLERFAFLGGGHMAQALIKGLVLGGVQPQQIHVLDRNADKCALFRSEYSVGATHDLKTVLNGATTLIIVVRPNDVKPLLMDIAQLEGPSRRIISCASGLTCEQLQAWLNPQQHTIIRAMPNLPASVQSGITALYADDDVLDQDRVIAENLMRSVGSVFWINIEDQLHEITGVSGSGPGYVFRLMDAMTQAAVKLGVPEAQARMLVVSTFLGSAHLALAHAEPLSELCQAVCVKGGTTERGIDVFNRHDVDGLFDAVLKAVVDRSRELH